MAKIDFTENGVHKEVLEVFLVNDGVYKRVSGAFTTESSVYKNIYLDNATSLQDTSWAAIAAASANGTASHKWAVGDIKVDQLTDGTPFVAQIVGFDHDNLADGSGKAGISFMTLDVSPTSVMLASSGNVVRGYVDTDVHTTYLPDVYSRMDTALQSVIKSVRKQSTDVSVGDILWVDMTLWVPSGREITTVSAPVEGEPYELYEGQSSSARVKYMNGKTSGTGQAYWTRTAVTPSVFFRVSGAGLSGSSAVNVTTNYISFGFCI